VGDSLCAIEIFGEERGGQAEDSGIRADDRLLLRRKSLKNSAPGTLHDRAAANNYSCIPFCIFDQAIDALDIGSIDHGAHLTIRIIRAANHDLL
jgi:hypothetical protein